MQTNKVDAIFRYTGKEIIDDDYMPENIIWYLLPVRDIEARLGEIDA